MIEVRDWQFLNVLVMLICPMMFLAFCQHLLPAKWEQVSKTGGKLFEGKKLKSDKAVPYSRQMVAIQKLLPHPQNV